MPHCVRHLILPLIWGMHAFRRLKSLALGGVRENISALLPSIHGFEAYLLQVVFDNLEGLAEVRMFIARGLQVSISP